MSDAPVSEIVRAFERFVDSGYQARTFTKPLYHALSRSFGFIAHYDRYGFHRARFATAGARVVTFAQILHSKLYQPGPIEVALQEVVKRRVLHDKALSDYNREIETSERAELARLKEKHEQ